MNQKTISISLPISLSASIQILVLVGLSVLSFSIPFSVGYPQWLVGTIVNACLFLAAIFLPQRFIIPLIILPGLGVLSRGLVFGPLTVFLAYFLPFIWLANLVLILVFKRYFFRSNYLLSVLFAALAKSLFLFMVANIYLEFSIVPGVFLQSMGINQFLTALAGGAISLIIFNLYGRNNLRDKRTA